MTKPKYDIIIENLDIDLSDYRDSYLNGNSFEGHGNDLDEVLSNGVIFTCDQDGGEGPQIEFDSLGRRTRDWLEELIIARMANADDKAGAQ